MGLQRYTVDQCFNPVKSNNGYFVKADEAEEREEKLQKVITRQFNRNKDYSKRIRELEEQLAKSEEMLNEVIEWNKKYPPLSKDL